MARPNYPSDDVDKLLVRFPEGMRDRLKAEAEKVGRSMNAEIITRLRLTLQEEVWEREKFINTLNFKQHIIDKQLHMLSAQIAEKSAVREQLIAEKAIRAGDEIILRLLCLTIFKHPEAPEDLKAMADQILMSLLRRERSDNGESLDQKLDLMAAIGDRDDIGRDWEDTLSEEDKQRLAEARKWVKDEE